MRPAIATIALACVACSARLGSTVAPGDGELPVDGSPATDDGPEPDAPLGAWGAPQKVGVAATGLAEDDASLSQSGLELVFARVNTTDNQKDLFYTSRPDLQSAFGPVTKLPFSADNSAEETPRFSDDDLTLFFAKTNAGNALDIHRVTRPAPGSTAWGTPSLVQGVNGALVDKWFMPCDGNRYLMILVADVAEGTLGGGAPTVVGDLSTAQSETGPFVTSDCLTTYFASTRPDGATNRIYTSSRAAVGQPWSTPVVFDDFAALGGDQQDPFLSKDQRTFVFVSNADGTNDVYISTR
jgi:hypothetical protein